MKNKNIRSVPVDPDEVTPQALYLSRRKFIKGMGLAALGALLASCEPRIRSLIDSPGSPTNPPDTLTSYDDITNYVNFYEYTVNKNRVAELAQGFVTDPWSLEVGGMVENPHSFSMEEMRANFIQEERIYRMRCVEGWSMVIPWLGFPLHKLLAEVKPLPGARYVSFTTVMDPEHMPGLNSEFFFFPYLEGLRLDEAQHDLTLLATGLYGEPLPPQNGAPIRLVVPWKYGFKSIKSLVSITLVADQPPTFWNTFAPHEYGFYANVNPAVDHPRWSQATEVRIGENSRRDTLLMNGYAGEVMPLYKGMDLKVNF
ncbi:MAG TPA: protein-methionine-sulfoxide reductase catalytic subunit MsrP [Brevefilum fermentans]|jgi:sulfoxide reductase catalytic subunit YedY|uniref:Protein-methionine-sulfoxide reductase catalytic subunit MsrP n=1 Tax=Candidatus Brevifilum fermentans TaxID=1986204 RepID=A0A1Y6K0W9_9CHLR|nr:protein-methionine-sulfoxide reductase catalytic subunit MsrP [Brevefilum fermentans]OQB84094.1 MAG: Sulfoxide reductase catalytic subunit YedY precursor [Chloroflexi bacterium ADurb.Bin120]SMX53335.1 Sulfoxide reductase catalytic subunit YedY [Brevefilum fermentans]HOM67618.1 protein-methionine-sulfoxide reductase catalytic subunit MsrP [Brevefilum fermentans]HQA28761.1 protein-methionine-sulfoxide reductase catalytic subunit MsrP [Brevefilum fermentans]